MKNLSDILLEKLKIDKDIDVITDYDLLSFDEFVNHIHDNIMKTTSNLQIEKMLVSKCFPDVSMPNYNFYYIDPEKYRTHWNYKYSIELVEKILKDKDYTEFDVNRIYVDNVIQLYVYHYVNVNLSDDDGDEHFVWFIDRINKKYAIYQFIKKDGGKWIKKL